MHNVATIHFSITFDIPENRLPFNDPDSTPQMSRTSSWTGRGNTHASWSIISRCGSDVNQDWSTNSPLTSNAPRNSRPYDQGLWKPLVSLNKAGFHDHICVFLAHLAIQPFGQKTHHHLKWYIEHLTYDPRLLLLIWWQTYRPRIMSLKSFR